MSCEWLTPYQASLRMSVSTASIWRWIRNDRLTYSRTPGGAIRICKDELMKGSVYRKDEQ